MSAALALRNAQARATRAYEAIADGETELALTILADLVTDLEPSARIEEIREALYLASEQRVAA